MSDTEQGVASLGLVSEKFEIRKEFVGLVEIAPTGVEIIYEVIADVLLRLNLSSVPSQCNDGAATMTDAISGVATKLSAAEHKVVFTHCYGTR